MGGRVAGCAHPVARLHIHYLKAFGVQSEPRYEDDWTEEDDAELAEIWKRIQAKRDAEEGVQGPDEEDSESDGSDEDRPEESESDET
jgi:hypothetical protein